MSLADFTQRTITISYQNFAVMTLEKWSAFVQKPPGGVKGKTNFRKKFNHNQLGQLELQVWERPARFATHEYWANETHYVA